MDAGKILSLLRYGDTWRLGRRVFHQEFNSLTSSNFVRTQEKYANTLLNLIKDDPARFGKHLKFFSSGIPLDVTYGFDVKPVDDPYVKIAEDGLEFVKGLIPGSYLVDAFPSLRHIPDRFPGAQ